MDMFNSYVKLPEATTNSMTYPSNIGIWTSEMSME